MKWGRIYHSYSQQTKGPRTPALVPQRCTLVFLSLPFKLFSIMLICPLLWSTFLCYCTWEVLFRFTRTQKDLVAFLWMNGWINGYWELTESISSPRHFTTHSSLEHHPSSQWNLIKQDCYLNIHVKGFFIVVHIQQGQIYKTYTLISF